MSYNGDPVKGEVSDANAGGTAIKVLFYPAGSTTAVTIGANDFLTITDYVFVSTIGGAGELMAAAVDAAGVRIFKGSFDAKGGVAISLDTPITCPKGVTPYLLAAAGQVDLVLTGFITKA